MKISMGINLDDWVLSALDKERGLIPRSRLIQDLIVKQLQLVEPKDTAKK